MIAVAPRRLVYTILWAGLTTVLLWGLYSSLKSSLGQHEKGPPGSHTYSLSISASHLGETPPVLSASQGDTVHLTVSSDRAGELHVHGYEKSIKLRPAGKVTLTFVAQDVGSFPVHLHERDGLMLQLAVLEVQPR